MSAIKEHERVILTVVRPAQKLAVGAVGDVIHEYLNGAAFDVEFVALNSATIAVITVENSWVR